MIAPAAGCWRPAFTDVTESARRAIPTYDKLRQVKGLLLRIAFRACRRSGAAPTIDAHPDHKAPELNTLTRNLAVLLVCTAPALAAETLSCPVAQTAVAADADPDVELFKQLIRCKKGEKAAPAGAEGTVTVEVASVQVGKPRPWSYRQDSGSGSEDTTVYPVKTTYTVRTHYRAATEVENGWVRILNFYVDSFGEWQIGSEEPVQSPSTARVPVS